MRIVIAIIALFAACQGPKGRNVSLPGGSPGIGFDDLRYSPRLGRVLVPGGRSGALHLIDPETLAVTAIEGFAASPDFSGGHDDGVTSADDTGRWILATDRTRRQLVVVDPDAAAIATRADLAGGPDYVRWVEATGEAWVTSPGRERIEIFRLSDDGALSPDGEIAVPGGPESLVIDGTRGRAYSHLWDGATVAIDLAARQVVATWPNGCPGSRGIALDEERGFLFAACSNGRVALLDVDHGGKVLGEIWPVDGTDVIDYRPELHHLYVAGRVSANLAIVGVAKDGEMALLGLKDAALESHCAVADDRGHVYACDPDGGRILVRDDPFDAIQR
jgi:hypothetical protein